MAEEKTFKFVIIGSGNIANTYISVIEKIENAEVVGIISRSLKKSAVLKNNSQILISDSLSKINTDFDAVIICVPNYLHHTFAVESASMGKHVLTEKPLDISIDAIDEMISACRKANVKLGVAYQRRMSGDNFLLKKMIDSNMFGKIFAVSLSVKNFRHAGYYSDADYRGTWKKDGGGPFIQQASHYVDLYAWYFGKPAKIESYLNTFIHNIEVEDYGVAVFIHDNGMIGTLTASTACKPGFPARMEIHSEKGTVILEDDIIIFWSIDGIENPRLHKKTQRQEGADNHLVKDTTNHELIIKDFIQAVKENREPFITGESARMASEIILQIYFPDSGGFIL
jgi:UDP-N-acetyl-2-amino-2-deoxyglucuronate dehydrogenase